VTVFEEGTTDGDLVFAMIRKTSTYSPPTSTGTPRRAARLGRARLPLVVAVPVVAGQTAYGSSRWTP